MKSFEEIEILIEGLDINNITSLLNKWNEVTIIKNKLKDLEEMLKLNIKSYLKERNWKKYLDDESKISVSISSHKRVSFDNEQIKHILSEQQYAQVIKTKVIEKMMIITPKTRERLKKYVKTPKKLSDVS